jgi:hypothetical protein
MRMGKSVYGLSIFFLVVGSTTCVLGLPYAIANYSCGRWCGGNAVNMGSNPPLGWVLAHDDMFSLFMPYGLITALVGSLLFLAYRVERTEKSPQSDTI